MKTFVIDSNIVFSALLNKNSRIGEFILTNGNGKAKFYAPSFLRIEIENHFNKIVSLTKSTPDIINEVRFQIYQKINFISDDQIPFEYFKTALPLVTGIDTDDIAFVALNEYLNELLWTGDTTLYNGLIARGYSKVVMFNEVIGLLKQL